MQQKYLIFCKNNARIEKMFFEQGRKEKDKEL